MVSINPATKLTFDVNQLAYNSILAARSNYRKFNNHHSAAADCFQKSAAQVDPKFDSIDPVVKEVADNCATSAKYIKKYYDKLYGAGNWEYISIGRSCAKVADCLDELGVKSHIIPISGLTDSIENGREIVTKEGFGEFRNYIYNLGLTPSKKRGCGSF